MANIIKIKRSANASAPGSLSYGELANSFGAGTQVNGGDRFYIGDSGGNPVVIGGKYFTDMLDHVKGELTASSALIVDADSRLDTLKVGVAAAHLVLDDNIISVDSTTLTDQNIIFTPKADGVLTIAQQVGATQAYEALVTADDHIPNKKYVDDGLSAQSTLTVRDDTADNTNDQSVDLGSDVLKITGGEGIDSAVAINGGGDLITVTISGEDATTTNKGIASFDANDFTVTAGAVSLKALSVENGDLVNDSITLGTTEIALGGSASTIADMVSIEIAELTYDTDSITATGAAADININLVPKGAGTVDVGSSRITSVSTPTQDSDAATKAYVDSVSQGLDIKESVRVATTEALVVTASNGPGTPPSVGKTLTGPQEVLAIDGVTLALGDRVLVKDQNDGTPGLSVDNGIYTVTTLGVGGTTAWVLTRAEDADGATLDGDSEVTAGMFTFVSQGTANANNGYVLSASDPITLETTAISFVQFSGAGSVIAGDGLTKDGNTIDVVGTADRITANADSIDIASTYVGQTSITTLGTVTTGTWNADTVTVPYGGTGVTTFTSNGIVYGNGVNALQVTVAGTWDATNSIGQILSVDSNQVPTWTNTIDGGTY